MQALLLWFTFMTAASITAIVFSPRESSSALVRRAMAAAGTGAPADALDREELHRPLLERTLRPQLLRLGSFLMDMTPVGARQRMTDRLRAAGNETDAGSWLAHKAIFAVVAMAVAGLLTRGHAIGILGVGAGGILGWRVPDMQLERVAAMRRRVMARALPDVLDLLSVSVEAGLGFDGAMQKVAEKFPGPVAAEFGTYLRDVRLGTGREAALRAIASRCGVPELQTTIAVIIQAEKLGASLSRVLRVQSDDLRVRRRQLAQERAQQIPVKLIFPLALFIFPTIFVVLLGPAGLHVIATLSHTGA